MMVYIVVLEQGVYLALGGDPGRTTVPGSARRYSTRKGAGIALGMARRFRPFLDAYIVSMVKVVPLK